jgi:hypothetical protein
MANFFDKFDEAAPASGNPFDQFDEPTKPTEGGFAPREVRERETTRDERKGMYREMARGVRERQSAPMRYVDTALRGAARAVPFMNEASAGLNYLTGMGGDSYEDSLDRERAMSDVDDTDRTALSVGSQMAGMVVMPGSGWANSGRLAGRIAKGGALGGVYGGLYGAGDGDTMGERASNALEGTKTGAIFGAAGTGAFEALRGGVGALGTLAAPIRGYRRPVEEAERRIAAGLGQDRAVGGRLLSDSDYAAAAAAGQDPMMIDRGGATIRAMARDARNTSPEAAQQLEGALAGRAGVQNDAAGDFLSQLFSPLRSPNPEATVERLQRRAQAANGANYRRAEQAAENLISPGGRVNPAFPDGLMTPVLDRLAQSPLVQSAMQKSLSTGMNDAALRGFRVTPPTNPFVRTDQGFVLRPPGPNGDRVLPTLAYWDQVQRNLRSVAKKAKISGDDNLARQANGMRSQLISHLDEILPDYQTARQGAARFFGAEDALEAGENFFAMTKRGDTAKARQAVAKMTASERGLFAEGYLAAAEHAARSTGDGRTASNMKMWNSPAAREKLELAVGPRRAREALAYRDRAEILEWSNNAVRGNSSTVMQLASLGLAGGAAGAYATGDLSGGVYGAMVAPLVKLGMKGIKGRVDDRVSRELARLLTSTNPATHQRIINSSRNQQQLTEALNHIASTLPKVTAPVADEVNDRRREPQGYAEGGMVDSMAGFLPPDAAAPMREEMGPPMAARPPMTAETLPELDPFAGEKALGRGAVDAAQTAGRYLRDTPISQMPSDAGKLGGMMWEGAKEDPVGFVLDVLPIIGETRSGMEARDLLMKADEAEAGGDSSMASQLRQFAAVAAAGAIPAAGMGARVAKRATKVAGAAADAPPTLSSIIQRGVPIEPKTPRPDDAAREAALADTRMGADIVGQRINTLIPEQDRVVGGTYTPGAPGGTRWADMPDEVLSKPGVGFRVADEELQQLWQDSVAQSSAAAKKAVADNGVTPQFLSKDWDAAMKTPLRDHLWYELSGERLAENMPDLSPDEFMQFMDLIGATSARAAPGENLERALGVLSQKLQGRPVDVDLTIPSTVQQALGRDHASGSSALPGNKTGYFSDTLALTGGVPTRFPISVNDVWVGKMFGVPDDVMSSNQALHEPMAAYFNKIRDLYNERHGGEVPFQYQSWNFQAPAWVHLRNKEAGATSGDAYHQVWGGILDKLKAAGVKGIKGDVITREALMDPKFADAVRRTTAPWRDAPKATVEFGTTQTNVGRSAYDLYRQAIDSGDDLSQQEYLGGLTTAMYQSARGKHPWDALKKAVTGVMGTEGEITRIAVPTSDAPLDIGGTFEGMVSPNIRVPLKDMSDAQQRYFNAIAGGPLRQDAMAASQFLPVDAGAAPREGHIRTMAVFVPTTEAIGPAEIRAFSKAMSEAGHDLSYARYPNGYKFDILPNFNGDAPVGPTPDALRQAYTATMDRFGAPTVLEHDFKSVYTPGDDYSTARTELLTEMKNDFIAKARAAKIPPGRAAKLAERAADPKTKPGSVPAGLTSRGRKAWDSYRARLGALADAEQGFQALAERVASSHATFIEKATKRAERARKRAEKVEKKARGGYVGEPLDQSDDALHEYLMATVAPPVPRRFAMGGAVFPAAVEPRMNALSQRRVGALSRRH